MKLRKSKNHCVHEMNRFHTEGVTVSLLDQCSSHIGNIFDHVDWFRSKPSDKRILRAVNALGPERKPTLRKLRSNELEMAPANVEAGQR